MAVQKGTMMVEQMAAQMADMWAHLLAATTAAWLGCLMAGKLVGKMEPQWAEKRVDNWADLKVVQLAV
jgi:hypothetical protein